MDLKNLAQYEEKGSREISEYSSLLTARMFDTFAEEFSLLLYKSTPLTAELVLQLIDILWTFQARSLEAVLGLEESGKASKFRTPTFIQRLKKKKKRAALIRRLEQEERLWNDNDLEGSNK